MNEPHFLLTESHVCTFVFVFVCAHHVPRLVLALREGRPLEIILHDKSSVFYLVLSNTRESTPLFLSFLSLFTRCFIECCFPFLSLSSSSSSSFFVSVSVSLCFSSLFFFYSIHFAYTHSYTRNNNKLNIVLPHERQKKSQIVSKKNFLS